MRVIYWSLLVLITSFNCASSQDQSPEKVLPGAYQTSEYLPLLENKNIGICTNQSGIIEGTHLVDSLISLGFNVKKVFSPEHGFRGKADAGEKVETEENDDQFELISLYGKNRRPTKEQLSDLDLMIFDIQDVGVRFFTYLSTLTYLMEACAEIGLPLLILDRPNPNGSYVDGPVMEDAHKSFLGLHPIPIVHGLTPGEFALMLNGENWLEEGLQCDLTIIKSKNWDHQQPYSLPVKPSPNLPDDVSISWYPSLCLFEQTICSVGRGTNKAFQHIGHPDYPDQTYSFTPVSQEGAKTPIFENQICYGVDFGTEGTKYEFTIQPLIDFHKIMDNGDFFKPYLHRLAGTKDLQSQIESGWTEQEIRKSWEPALSNFKEKRKKYLLYP